MADSRSFDEFYRRMQLLARGVGENAEKAVRRAALRADQVVVTSTPVDTGRARANWIASVGAPAEGTVEPPAAEAGRAEAAATQKALDQAAPVIEGFRLGQGSIFITNNVEYIVPLDRGSSRQAPQGMTAQAFEAARAELARARLLEGT